MSEKCRFAQLLLLEDQMRKNNIRIAALALIVLVFLSCPNLFTSTGGKGGSLSGNGASRSVFDSGRECRDRAGSQCCSSIDFGCSRSDGAAARWLCDRGERREWFSLHCRAIMGEPERCVGLLESQNARPHLLQSGSRKHFSAYLSYEDQAGTRRKIESGDRRGNRVGTREERTAPACAWSDVLHDVEDTVSERRRQELSCTRDVSCCG